METITNLPSRPKVTRLNSTGAILLYLGWYNKTPQTGWLIKHRNALLTVLLQAVSPRSGFQHGLVRALTGQQTFLASAHGRRSGSSEGSRLEACPVIRAPFSLHHHLQKSLPSPWICTLEGHEHSDHAGVKWVTWVNQSKNKIIMSVVVVQWRPEPGEFKSPL